MPGLMRPDHVTLIRPAKDSSIGEMSDPVTTPVGLAYVAAAIREAGFSVSVVDASIADEEHVLDHEGVVLHGLTPEETLARVPPHTTIIGVSCMFSQDWPSVRVLIQALRERFPDALLIAGGEHISAVPEFSLQNAPDLDICVLGEGEETAVEIVQHAHDREQLEQIRGIAFLRAEEGAEAVVAETLAGLCALEGIDCLGLDQMVPPGREREYFFTDRHWTVAGNEAVAKALLEYLSAEGAHSSFSAPC